MINRRLSKAAERLLTNEHLLRRFRRKPERALADLRPEYARGGSSQVRQRG